MKGKIPEEHLDDIVGTPEYRKYVRELRKRKWPKRKLKLYADEDISAEVVRYLRKRGCNVLHVLEQPRLRSRDDNFHYTEARKRGRLLLTRDERFMDNRAFPLQLSPGVIILETGQHVTDVRQAAAFERIFPMLEAQLRLEPKLTRSKFKVAKDGFVVELINFAGKRVRLRG